MNFQKTLLVWISEYQKRLDDLQEQGTVKTSKIKIHHLNLRRFVRISTVNSVATICVAFVARDDFETKYLGKVRTGDVFRAASCKAPTRRSCGNIFEPLNGLAHLPGYFPLR